MRIKNVNLGKEVSIQNAPSFPRKSGFASETEIHFIHLYYVLHSSIDVPIAVLNVYANCAMLGQDAVDYIVANIGIFEFIRNGFERSLTKELIYSKTYTKLVSYNLYRELCGKSSVLPKVLSKRFTKIREDLKDYITGCGYKKLTR